MRSSREQVQELISESTCLFDLLKTHRDCTRKNMSPRCELSLLHSTAQYSPGHLVADDSFLYDVEAPKPAPFNTDGPARNAMTRRRKEAHEEMKCTANWSSTVVLSFTFGTEASACTTVRTCTSSSSIFRHTALLLEQMHCLAHEGSANRQHCIFCTVHGQPSSAALAVVRQTVLD